MDDVVLRSMAKWPNVPAVYGWLQLDRRGNWLLRAPGGERYERIANASLREFIARNYAADERGRWYFQNGPQRVYVRLAYTPLVVHHEDDGLLDHCGRRFRVAAGFLDEEGSVLFEGEAGVPALLDDRDLERYAEGVERFPVIARAEVPGRFGFRPDPRPGA